MASNIPLSSFINLFKKIIYNKEENKNPILDIWDSYIISSFYKNELQYFEIYNVSSTDTWASLALKFYGDARLWWIIPLFNEIEDPFIVLDQNVFLNTVGQIRIMKSDILNSMLFEARQNKIINDSNIDNINEGD